MTKKIIIIGGVAGGATAATRLRRLNEKDQIILFEKGEYISFANCGLPYHIGETIKNREDLLLQTVEGMSQQYRLDIRNLTEVMAINPDEKFVKVKNHQTGESYIETFDQLIISTGAKALVPPIKGLDEAENTFSLRNIPDMDEIISYIKAKKVTRATIVGGGFIGLEMMENLHELGIEVQLVEMSPQVMPNIDFEMAQIIHSQINLHKVNLLLNDGLQEFKDKGKKLVLSSGKVLETDLTILAIGVTPENTLAQQAGIELGHRGAIKVDEMFRTNKQDIYAIGDVIEVTDFINRTPTTIPLAWPANRQARLVADIINGSEVSYPGTLGTSVAKVFELTVAATGNNERTLKRLGIDYQAIHIHPNSHAGYYPGASPLMLKLLMGQDGKILGAQGIGTKGVEKRIDVIASAIKFGATAPQLAEIELSYAPPYSSAKDPVNLLGYVADNLLHDKIETFSWDEIPQLKSANAFFLDVREEFEIVTGQIEGSVLISLADLRVNLDQLPKEEIIYVYCQVGVRGYNAARILMQNGFKVKNLDGGYKTFKQATYELMNFSLEKAPERDSVGEKEPMKTSKKIVVDACGLQCPGPILKVKETIDQMEKGQELEIQASDFGFSADIEAWCKHTGNELISNMLEGDKVVATIVKGKKESLQHSIEPIQEGLAMDKTTQGATMVVFSGDLDKALASMIIATGAAAMGKNVTIFFTFWGLSILKKEKIKKKGLAKMFDIMLPNNADKLPVSNMNMGGLGAKMIKKVMKDKNVETLPAMLEKAQQLGVKFIACTMSMDIMGIEKSELYDFVEYGGVATYLGDSEEANLNLFI